MKKPITWRIKRINYDNGNTEFSIIIRKRFLFITWWVDYKINEYGVDYSSTIPKFQTYEAAHYYGINNFKTIVKTTLT